MTLNKNKRDTKYYRISKELRQELAVDRCIDLQVECLVSQHYLSVPKES